MPLQKIARTPQAMPKDGGNGARPQHEMVQVFVECQHIQRREQKGQQAEPPQGHVGRQHYSGETDGATAKRRAAAGQVVAQRPVDLVAHPAEVAIRGLELRDYAERQAGVDSPHALDETSVKVVGSRGEYDL